MPGSPRFSLLAASLGLAACTTILGADGLYTGEGGGGPSSTSSTGATTVSAGSGAGGDGSGGRGGAGSGGPGGAGAGGGEDCPRNTACLASFPGVEGKDVRLAASPWAQMPRATMLVRTDTGATLHAIDPGGWSTEVPWKDGAGWLAAPFARNDSEGYARWVEPNDVELVDEAGSLAEADLVAGVQLPFAVQGSPSGVFLLARPEGSSIPVVQHLTVAGSTQGANTCAVASDPLVLLDLASFGSQWVSVVRCQTYVEAQHGDLLGGGSGNFLVSTDTDTTGLSLAANAQGGAVVLAREGEFEIVPLEAGDPWSTPPGGTTRLDGLTPSVAVRGLQIHVAYEQQGEIRLARCDREAGKMSCRELEISPAGILGTRPRLAFDGTIHRLAWVEGNLVRHATVTLSVD